MILSDRIKELRRVNRLTQAEFGKLFELSESTVSLYEAGKRTPDLNTVIKICRHFNVAADWLLGLSDVRQQLNAVNSDSTQIKESPAQYSTNNIRSKIEELQNRIDSGTFRHLPDGAQIQIKDFIEFICAKYA